MDSRWRCVPAALIVAAALAGTQGCKQGEDESGEGETGGAEIDPESLRDPEACAECHPIHYREWLGSMHAYAAEDPVFRALNAKAQRETNGAVGDFCVKCHAPVAVELGLTEDGLNLDELPPETLGVTCWFCHQVDAVEGTHNNPLSLAMDTVMRGSLSDALEPDAHHVGGANTLFERNHIDSSAMCGSCHDIVNPEGAHIERSYDEWQASFYSDVSADDPTELEVWGLSCNDCHMNRTTGAIADYPGVPGDRDRHSHSFVGVDVALSDFPDAELGPELRAEQLAEIEDVRKTSLCASLCVRPEDDPETGAEITVWLHNEAAGHSWPSGATPDRRAWVELIARDDTDQILYSSGVVDEDQAIAELADPNLWLMRDRIFDAEGNETHAFWAAATIESNLLLAAEDISGDADTWKHQPYAVDALPTRVNMRVRLRPMGLEILHEAIESGDLDAAVLDELMTFDVPPSMLEWTPETATPTEGEVDYGTCVSSSPGCLPHELQGE